LRLDRDGESYNDCSAKVPAERTGDVRAGPYTEGMRVRDEPPASRAS
jgi:hypothetical protein